MVKKKQRRKIDHEKFVREWQLAASVAEVAERMDVPASTVHAVARRLRDARCPHQTDAPQPDRREEVERHHRGPRMIGLLGIGIEDVRDLAEHVPDDVHIAANNTAATAAGGFEVKLKTFHRALAPYALHAVLRAREVRVLARARATNVAARCRTSTARRPSSARTRRSRRVRTVSRGSPSSSDGDGESSRESVATDLKHRALPSASAVEGRQARTPLTAWDRGSATEPGGDA